MFFEVFLLLGGIDRIIFDSVLEILYKDMFFFVFWDFMIYKILMW